jgi:hypothetical protein
MENNPKLEWCSRQELQNHAAKLIKPALSVLDIGCGIHPQQFVTPEMLICIEPHPEYVEILKENLRHTNAIIIPLDAAQALKALPSSSVDSIFLIDVIEHMTKEVGMYVIRECERVARLQVVIFTPLGFMPQETHAGDADGWNLHGGELQDHKSGWYPEDFPLWNIVACKHLHTHDVKGQPINPPYGGFYAVKSIAKVANYFNDIDSQDVLHRCTNNLSYLQVLFPKFIDQVVYRDIANVNLKCGIQSCQRTTELFIELGASKSTEEIFEIVNGERDDAYLAETHKFNTKLSEFASQFSDFNAREAELTTKGAELAQREAELTTKGAELAQREAELTINVQQYNSLPLIRIFRFLKRKMKL